MKKEERYEYISVKTYIRTRPLSLLLSRRRRRRHRTQLALSPSPALSSAVLPSPSPSRDSTHPTAALCPPHDSQWRLCPTVGRGGVAWLAGSRWARPRIAPSSSSGCTSTVLSVPSSCSPPTRSLCALALSLLLLAVRCGGGGGGRIWGFPVLCSVGKITLIQK